VVLSEKILAYIFRVEQDLPDLPYSKYAVNSQTHTTLRHLQDTASPPRHCSHHSQILTTVNSQPHHTASPPRHCSHTTLRHLQDTAVTPHSITSKTLQSPVKFSNTHHIAVTSKTLRHLQDTAVTSKTLRHLQDTAVTTVKYLNSKLFNDSIRTGHHRAVPGSIPGQFIWDLWQENW
jgi:hypothetical protein